LNVAPVGYAPSRPHLTALGFFCLWIAILSLPMWSGQFLAGPGSDMYATGYALRAWGAAVWRATGHVALWNPEMMGGVPVAAGFGDIYYPTAFLRLVLPTATAINLGFVAHYILAGFFTYLFLRMLRVSWLGAVVGGTAYQLSGVVASLVQPGHDGKLFVSALLPLMLIALILGLRRRQWQGYILLGFAVALALLSPHYQMTYYSLIVAGLFALYLAFGEPEGLTTRRAYRGLALAFGAVLLGFGVAMIQILPFYAYLPYSPRAEGMAGGFATATSYAIPWEHVPEFFLSGFTGVWDTYWGSNSLKLHSEYLGLPVIVLAALGVAAGDRRRLVRWLVGIGALFLLIALGSATPFYRVWWALMPYVKQTRAPGMAFFVVAFVVATFAAFGVERLERREGRRLPVIGFAVAGLIALLAASGVFGAVAEAFARGQEALGRRGVIAAAGAAQSGILWGALGSAAALAALAGLVAAYFAAKLSARAFAVALVLIIGADLWLSVRSHWIWSRPEDELYRRDAIVEQMQRTPLPYRVLDPPTVLGGAYVGTVLMKHNIPQVLGYHGNEIRYYDDLLGGKNEWRRLLTPQVWNLLAVRFITLSDSARVPGYHRILGPTQTAPGGRGFLYEADRPPSYARVVPAAIKGDSDAVLATIYDPRFDPDRLLLLTPDVPLNPLPVAEMPNPSPARATVTKWQPGRMSIALEPEPPAASYLVVSENWYKDWHASVDGTPVAPVRGNYALIAVPVPQGAKTVELWFDSPEYHRGWWITMVSLAALAGLAIGPVVARRLRRG
jgi:membrane protein YfhO